MEYNADGELHILDRSWGYALKFLEEPIEMTLNPKFYEICHELSEKYNDYRQRNGRTRLSRCLEVFLYGFARDDVFMIFRPAQDGSKASVGIKFKRLTDGLDEPTKSDS